MTNLDLAALGLRPGDAIPVPVASRLLGVPLVSIRGWLFRGRLAPAGELRTRDGKRTTLVRVQDVLELDRKRRSHGGFGRAGRGNAAA